MTRRSPGRDFPILGEGARATPASTQRWFVTAHSVVMPWVAGAGAPRPSSTAHAKRMGAVVTACGLPAISWPKLYEVRFPLPAAVNCRRCLQAVAVEP